MIGAAELRPHGELFTAEAEIAFAARDLGQSDKPLEAARAVLERHGDWANAAHAGFVAIRRLSLLGALDQAEAQLNQIDPTRLTASLQAIHGLTRAGLAMRRLDIATAQKALTHASEAAHHAHNPALSADVQAAWQAVAPAAGRAYRATRPSSKPSHRAPPPSSRMPCAPFSGQPADSNRVASSG